MKENQFGKPHDQTGKGRGQELAVPRDIAQHEETLETVSHEELVGRIKLTLERERQESEKWQIETFGSIEVPFDAVRWMGSHLAMKTLTQSLRNLNYGRDDKTLTNLGDAFDAISYAYIKPLENDTANWKKRVHDDLIKRAKYHERYINLDPKEVKLLDAMAEAVGVPRTRGETRVDLLQNFPPEQQQEVEEYHDQLRSEREARPYTPRKRETNFRTFLRWVSNVSKMLTPPEREVPAKKKKGMFRQMLDEYLEEASEPIDLPDKDDDKPTSDKK